MKKSRVQPDAEESKQTEMQPQPKSTFPTSLFAELADALPKFSLDLVKTVHGYLARPSASAGATPQQLLTIKHEHFGPCKGVAVGNDDRIWVSSGERVIMFSAEGNFLHAVSIGKDCAGIAFNANGEAYVADNGGHCLVVCGADGSVVRKIGWTPGRGDGQFWQPKCLVVECKQQLLFVGDAGRVQVLKLDGRGTFVGKFASGEGPHLNPSGIAMNAEGEVGVLDAGQCRVLVFACNGKFLRSFCNDGEGYEDGQLSRPSGLAVDSANQWIVGDYLNHRVQVFAADGSFVTKFDCERPYSVHVDCEGRILAGSMSYVFVFGFASASD